LNKEGNKLKSIKEERKNSSHDLRKMEKKEKRRTDIQKKKKCKKKSRLFVFLPLYQKCCLLFVCVGER
jgi:hypothetical protein